MGTVDHSQSTLVSQATRGTSLAEAFAELIHFRFLIFQSVLHPFEAIETYLPQFSMFWGTGKIFTPDTDVPDLSERVI